MFEERNFFLRLVPRSLDKSHRLEGLHLREKTEPAVLYGDQKAGCCSVAVLMRAIDQVADTYT